MIIYSKELTYTVNICGTALIAINKQKRVCQNANIILMILQFETIQ